MHTILKQIGAALLVTLLLGSVALAGDYQGTAKLGYVLTDIEGNQAMNQATFNVYDGAALSLEDFLWRFDNGARITADLKNLTMNNRNLTIGGGKPGLCGLNLHHDKYRRVYSFDGERFTRRHHTNAQAWYQPIQYIKVFGGYGHIERYGESVDFFGLGDIRDLNEVDFTRNYFNVGAQVQHHGGVVRLEYRGSDYTDDLNSLDNRKTSRFRAVLTSPVPRVKGLSLGAGYQRYEREVEERNDTLIANTGWAKLQYLHRQGYSLTYSVMLDRARDAGDITATDNLINAVYLGKLWPAKGAVTVGYSYQTNDDVFDEINTSGYYFDGWINATPMLLLKAGYGLESSEVANGRTLTGNRDYTTWRASAKYKIPMGHVRGKYDMRKTENDDIGASAEFGRISGDVYFTMPAYGSVTATYAFLDGEYVNDEGTFQFTQHVLAGDFYSREYKKTVVGVGGTYYRTKDDLDVESFTVRLSGRYALTPQFGLEILYSAYNFDNFDDPAPIYEQYYTANVVEFNLLYEL